MQSTRLSRIAGATLVLGMLASPGVFAGAIISDTGNLSTANIALGLNDDGALNFSSPTGGTLNGTGGAVGIAFRLTSGPSGNGLYDATSPGCLCEGWGIAVNAPGGLQSGGASRSNGGNGGLTVSSFTNTTTTATSIVALTGLSGLLVTHEAKAINSSLFQMHVTISNTTGAAVNNVRYTRVMDWDVPTTEFRELVTIKGVATTTALQKSHDDGFANVNPVNASSSNGILGSGVVLNKDFNNEGPTDHGAYFLFGFGDIAAGGKYEFDIFYGAAPNRAAADAAIGAAGIELVSYGNCATAFTTSGASCGQQTYIFGFKGVGGTVIVPPGGGGGSVPEPGSLALFALAAVALGLRKRRTA